jgi:hypothetical protein
MARQRTQTVRQKAKREHQKTVSGAASSGLCETSEMQTSDGWKRGNGKQRERDEAAWERGQGCCDE